jgi:hypothetical protein
VAGTLYGGSARENPGQIAAAMNNGNRVGPSRGYLYQLAAGAGWTSVPFLPFLRQPTLIMSGDDDPIIPLANAKVMHRLIPDSRLHVFSGGHLELITQAGELAPVVERFLNADGTGGPRSGRSRHRLADLTFQALQVVVHRRGRGGDEPLDDGQFLGGEFVQDGPGPRRRGRRPISQTHWRRVS